MIAASVPVQRSKDTKLLTIDSGGRIQHQARSAFVSLLNPGDLVVANDAATLPASLFGRHVRSGRFVEVRLAGRGSLDVQDIRRFSAIVFGEGDFRTRTEDRPQPPVLASGDQLQLGPLRATIVRILDHPRFVLLEFEGSPRQIWEGIAKHGRPIQYAHIPVALQLWDAWTPIAGPPVAFEPPSAGFALDWASLKEMRTRGVRFVTITHAAGISSTGDQTLDALLPFDEPYRIPHATASAIRQARASGGRVVAIGTTVVRALEHAAELHGDIVAGDGLANQKLGPTSKLRIVDAILSGTHETGTSHYELLRAFAEDETLTRAEAELESRAYRTHEFGDSVLIEKAWTKGHSIDPRSAAA